MQIDNYIAFGLSGSESGISMPGSDVTWTWMDNKGVHAEELNINAYSQVDLAVLLISCTIINVVNERSARLPSPMEWRPEMVHVPTLKTTSILYLVIEMAAKRASSTQGHCSQVDTAWCFLT